MTRKRPTPADVALVVDPMSKPDPLYALTCNLNRVEYGYPGHREPRFYLKEGWPPPKELEPMEEAPAWVPWSERHRIEEDAL